MEEEIKNSPEGELIGEIVHYFPHVGVAVIKLSASLSTGDTIRIIGGEDTDFNQTVDSMEINHQKIEKAKVGDEVGLKVGQKVREGYKVYKL